MELISQKKNDETRFYAKKKENFIVSVIFEVK